MGAVPGDLGGEILSQYNTLCSALMDIVPIGMLGAVMRTIISTAKYRYY